MRRSLYRDRLWDAPWGSERWSWPVICDSPDSWRLRDAPEQRLDERMSRLDFAWDAAPPLIDLRRVLPPAMRPEGIELDAEAATV